MSEDNPKPMNKEELEKYIEKDFLPSLLSKFPNIPDLVAENARLQAEVELLRKAGDAMADAIYEADPDKVEAHKNFKLTEDEYNSVALWNAAKGGKPSV